MDDITASITNRIERLERERQSASAKAADLRAKAKAADDRAEELASAIRHFKEWLQDLATNIEIDHDEPNGETGKVSVLPLVKEYLRTASDFSGAELVEAIMKMNPELSEPSIRSALSRCKSQGLVDQLEKNLYRPRRAPGVYLSTSTTNVSRDETSAARRVSTLAELAQIEADEHDELLRRAQNR